MKKSTPLFFSVFVVICFVSFATPERAQAASSVWTSSGIPDMYSVTYNPFVCIANCIVEPVEVAKYIIAGSMFAPVVSIVHSGTVRNNTRSTSGDSVVIGVGDSISFLPAADSGTDIAWSTSGGTMDTPFGNWSSDDGVSCDVVSQIYYGRRFPTAQYWEYAALNVTPATPVVTNSGTAGLNCDASGLNCTVTSPGTINATITWPATSGHFNTAYTKTGAVSPPSADWLPRQNCYRTSAFKDYSTLCNWGVTGSDPNDCLNTAPTYSLNVPPQSISFALSARYVNVRFSMLDDIMEFVNKLFGGSRSVVAVR